VSMVMMATATMTGHALALAAVLGLPAMTTLKDPVMQIVEAATQARGDPQASISALMPMHRALSILA
jgi:hypothetical protein